MKINIGGKTNVRKYGWTGLIVLVLAVAVVAFLYFDRRNEISYIILAWGIWGVLIAILLMGVICTTPIPSEGLMVLYLKIYGVYLGILYSWAGSILGSLAIFIFARTYGQKIMQRLIAEEHINTVDTWVKERGSIGLLVARLLPVPAFAVNYIAGVMPSMKLWDYLWTSALAMAPYYLSTAFVFLCVTKKAWQWLILGSIILIILGSVRYIQKRR